MMKRAPVAATPDAYVAALSGWQRGVVEGLRETVLASAAVAEVIKWGHLVYLSTAPCCSSEQRNMGAVRLLERKASTRDSPALEAGWKVRNGLIGAARGRRNQRRRGATPDEGSRAAQRSTRRPDQCLATSAERRSSRSSAFLSLRIGGARIGSPGRNRQSEALRLLDVPPQGRHRGLGPACGHTHRSGRRVTPDVSVQYADGEALFLWPMRDLHTPSATFESARVRIQRRVPGRHKSLQT